MTEFLHNRNTTVPIVIQKLKFAYLEWIVIQKHIPKISRYSLGVKIDEIFVDIIENSFVFITTRSEILIIKLIAKIDLLKFMLQTLLESKGIDNDKFISLNSKIEEMGKITFGIKRNLENKKPPIR